MDNQMDINEKFYKLEEMKYRKESIRGNNRLLNFWSRLDEEEYEDWESLNEYIENKY